MINRVTLIGRLCADPDVRFLPNGGQVTNINLATSMRWRDKSSGENKESSEFHRVVFFNRLAEVAGLHLKKGSQIYVEGRIQTRKWQDQDGKERYSTEIIAGEMQMLGSRRQGDRQDDKTPSKTTPVHDDYDDDIMF